MLHEILLCLLGNPGSLFRVIGNNIQLRDDIPMFHSHEVGLINKLASIGSNFRRLNAFALTNFSTKSLYIRAVIYGVEELLNIYRKKICEIENDVLRNPQATLASIKFRINNYFYILPDVLAICLEADQLRDTRILNVINDQLASGKAVSEWAVRLLQFHCHKVFFSQTAAWLLHGLVVDNNEEYFIQKSLDAESENQKTTGSESDIDSGTQVYNDVDNTTHYEAVAPEMDDRVNTAQRFRVMSDLLPTYITPTMAEKIRFIGECVRMFQHDSRNKKRYTSFFTKEEMYSSDLQKLSEKKQFDVRGFERVVEGMRMHVAEELWVLIVEFSDITATYHQLRDYFLLGNGQLITLFIMLARPVLNGTAINSNTQHDLNHALTRASALLNPLSEETDIEGQRVSLIVDYPESDRQPCTPTKPQPGPKERRSQAWGLISLKYVPQWPLHFVFSSTVLDRYNRVFKLLINIKQVDIALNQSWADLMTLKRTHLARYLPLLALTRSHMAFVLENLYYYLQEDVLSSNFERMLRRVNGTRDFESLLVENEKFLSLIMIQSFIDMQPVREAVMSLLDVCYLYHRLVEKLPQSESFDAKHRDLFERLTRNFNKHCSNLYRTLTSIMGYQPNPYLCQLLLRLDYNGYFSQNNGHLINFSLADSNTT